LAIGAVPLNLITNPAADVVVDMGSVARNCYTLNVPGTGNYINPDFFTFSTDGLFGNAAGSLGDIQLNYGVGSAAPLTITGRPVSAYGAPMTTVAYLGNGNFVDYDSIPPVSAFKTDSSLAKGAPISVDDIFCINLNPGHAWVQVTAVGNGSLNQGPSFRYRINSLLPYYGYEQTNADLGKGATCSTIW
jgi:hypothetical protein